MYKNLRWKLIVIVAVTALGLWSFVPPSQKVKLGLDLQGGVHLVMRVHTDDALKLETETTAEQLRSLQRVVEAIHIDEDVARYCVDLTRATRSAQHVAVGASPRGSQALLLLARALAALSGREYVRPDDVKRIAVPVLAHRLSLSPQAWAQGVSPERIVQSVAAQVPVPPTVGAPR